MSLKNINTFVTCVKHVSVKSLFIAISVIDVLSILIIIVSGLITVSGQRIMSSSYNWLSWANFLWSFFMSSTLLSWFKFVIKSKSSLYCFGLLSEPLHSQLFLSLLFPCSFVYMCTSLLPKELLSIWFFKIERKIKLILKTHLIISQKKDKPSIK